MAMSMLVLTVGINQAQAAQSIDELLYNFDGKDYFNCSYKGKKASKKCLVTMTEGRGSIDSRISSFYGSGELVKRMNIKWPDGDISRYVITRDNVIINLANKTDYEIRGYNYDSASYSRGFFIYSQGREHVRLW